MNYSQTQPHKFAVLVHTCDRYQFLYPGFHYFFSQHWDFDASCSYYFATEELTVDLPHFNNIKSGKGEWADRLRFLLQRVIKEQYIIYFQEDMWLTRPVSSSFFNQLFDLITQQQWKQVKLTSSDIYRTEPAPHFIEGFNIAKLDNTASGFLMSHQVTIWDKDFLIAQLHKGEHPWRNERKGTKRLKKLNPNIYQADYFAENGHPPINNNQPEAVQSEYFTISGNSILQNNVLPYIERLQQAGAEQQAYAKKLFNHYHNQLTHDGYPKPRKEDIFKKIKRFFKGE
jgi:hypothetical protein